MRFRTEIPVVPLSFPITHREKILLMGSCFTEHIGEKLETSGFQTDINPFGVLYNPLSLASGLQDLIKGKVYSLADIFEHQGLYASFYHHSRFSAPTKEECLEQINQRREESSLFLQQSSVLVVTFGTAFVYRLKETGNVVSNCHKLPADCFERKRLSVEDIVLAWRDLLRDLFAYNPRLSVLFTVSPIRHWKDGANGNQLSKASLLLAIEQIVELFTAGNNANSVQYFPSYELVLDDLRDYRYYAEDMLHPSPVAVNYIWEKFSTACFSKETQQAIIEYEKIDQALRHRPFHPESETYQVFIREARERLESFKKRFSVQNT